MKKRNWNSIINYTLDHPTHALDQISEHFDVPKVTLVKRLKAHGVDLQDRLIQMRKLRLKEKWHSILRDLNLTSMGIADIAAKYNVTHPTFIRFLDTQGYDRNKRNHRMRCEASARAYKTRRQPKQERKLDTTVIMDQRKECLSKDGKSLLAHTYPLNQIYLVFKHDQTYPSGI